MGDTARAWTLPLIGRRWLPAYRLAWIALFLITVASQIAMVVTTLRSEPAETAFRRVGLIAQSAPNGIILDRFGEASETKAVQSGDTLVAIDGHAVAPGMNWNDPSVVALLARPEGTRIRLTIRTGDAAPRAIVTMPSKAHLEQRYAYAGIDYIGHSRTILALTAIGSAPFLLTALLLFRRRARDPVVALISTGMVLNLAYLAQLYPPLPTWLKVLPLGASIPLLMIGLLFFPDSRLQGRTARWALALSVLSLFANFATPYLSEAWSTPLFVVQALAFLLAVVSVILRYRRLPPGMVRQQMRWVLFGLITCLALLAVYVAIQFILDASTDPALRIWLDIAGEALSSLESWAFSLGFLVSLLRYRLYDADALISRSAAYACLTLMLGAVFAGSETALEVAGGQFLGQNAGTFSAGVAAAIATAVVAPAHGRIHHWAEHRFQKGLVRLQQGLPRLLADMRETAELPVLLAVVLDRVAHGVRSSRAAVLLGTGRDWRVAATRDVDAADVEAWQSGCPEPATDGIDVDRDDPLFPVRVPLVLEDAGTIGWLLLGARPDGSLFGKDEREALAAVAEPIARAAFIVERRAIREASLHARIERLERALTVNAAST